MIEIPSIGSPLKAPEWPSRPDLASARQEPATALLGEIKDHREVINHKLEEPENLQTNKVSEQAPAEKNLSLYIRKNYPTWFNWTTIVLHSLASMLPFVSLVPKNISTKIKESAIAFSRWGVPVVKLHTAWEAFKGKRLFEAIARVMPTLFLPFLPFFNFQLAYGLSSGVNLVLEHMGKRTGELLEKDGFAVNNKKVIEGFKSMIRDVVKGVHIKERTELTVTLLGAAGMITGAIPALLFARNSLNSGIAKFFGSERSIGGFLGDLSIIFLSSKTDPLERRKEKIVGSFYLIPSMMDLLQRWMNLSPDANEIFNHAKTTLNTVAEVLWSSMSTDRNARQEESSANNNIPQHNLAKPAPDLRDEAPRKTQVAMHTAA